MTEVGSIFFDAELDDSGLVAATTKAAKRAAAVAEVIFTTDADFSDLAAKAKAAARAARQRVEFEAHLDSKGFIRDSRGLFGHLDPGDLPDFGGATDALNNFGSQAQRTARQAGLLEKAFAASAVARIAFLQWAAQAIPVVIGLGGAMVALASAVAFAAGGAVAGLATGLGAIAAAAVTVRVGLGGLDDAFTAVAKAQQEQAETGKISAATLKAQKQALNQLAPSARHFVQAAISLQDAWKGVQRTVQAKLFAGLGGTLRSLGAAVLPVLGRGLGGIATTLNGAAKEAAGFIKGLAKSGELDKIFSGLNAILKPLLGAVGGFASGLLALFQGSLPFGQKFANAIEGIGESFSTWAAGFAEGGGLEDFLNRAWEAGSKLWDILKNIGSIIGSVLGGGEDTGQGFLDSIEEITGKWADFLKSTEGQQKIQGFFDDAVSAVGTLKEALLVAGPILSGFLQGLKDNQPQIDAFLQALGKMAGPLKALGQALGIISMPLSLVALGLSALVNFLSGIDWAGIGAAISGAFGAAFSTLQQRLGEAGAGLTGFLGQVGSFFAGLGAAIGGFFAMIGGAIGGFFITIGTAISTGFGQAISTLQQRLSEAGAGIAGFAASIPGFFAGLATSIITAAGDLLGSFIAWASGIVGQAVQFATRVVSAFAGLAGRIISAAGSLIASFTGWLAGLPGAASRTVSSIVAAFGGLAGKIIAGAGSIVAAFSGWVSGVIGAAQRAASGIVGAFSGLGSRIASAIGTIVPNVSLPDIPGLPEPFAAGGVVRRPTLALVGEAGPEAIVPLRRTAPLDPAISNLLASVAATRARVGPGGEVSRDGMILVEEGASLITVVMPTGDPQAAAMAVVNRLAFETAI